MAATKQLTESHDVLSTPAPVPAPTYEEIELRAHQIWQTRLHHGIEGSAEQDWRTAEEELNGAKPESPNQEDEV